VRAITGAQDLGASGTFYVQEALRFALSKNGYVRCGLARGGGVMNILSAARMFVPSLAFSMATRGGLWENRPMADILDAFRAGQVPSKQAFEPDIVLAQVDVWFRLGARDPGYDNSQARAAIEPKLATAQLDEAKKQVAARRALDFEKMKATRTPVPGQAGRTCPATP
jgi:hypothetical protein